jgi:DNA-binding response OmpR family regulator
MCQHQVPKRLVSGQILVVDEDPDDLKVYRSVLDAFGFAIYSCSSYEAGLECLENGQFDLVLVSQGSPAFEGRRVLHRSLQMDRNRAVLIVTRCVHMPCYLEAMQMGAVDYLEKPVSPNLLLRFAQTYIRNVKAGLRRIAA